MTEPEKTPAFNTDPLRFLMGDWEGMARDANDTHNNLRGMVSLLADTEDVPIQMVGAALKLAENYLNVADQLLGMKTNFTRWLDAIDGKHVADEAGGVDGLGA